MSEQLLPLNLFTARTAFGLTFRISKPVVNH